ncbi:MAG: MucR family transcriptional regulator [Acidiphilium sp. 34-60-192]|nr:MAG: MucR family transcriptional regulator [Acidiphilium sp. 34-60-192]
MSEMNDNQLLLQLTTQIIAAHVSHNSVTAETLPTLIRDVYQSLSGVEIQEIEPEAMPEPVVNPKKSVFHDYIICLEDGKKLKMLRRHLRLSYNMTPEDYRQRWQLPAEYPMVAPAYAAARSAFAKKIGLGTKPAPAAPPSPAAAALRKKKAA